MRRVCALAAVVAVALCASAPFAAAATMGEPEKSEVTSLSVVPAKGAARAEVVIAVDGAVDVQDFTLASPARVVVDLRGARLAVPAQLYDNVARGSVTDVRLAQYTSDVVRVVIELDEARDYTVTRGSADVRVSIDGGAGSFPAWRVGADSGAESQASQASNNARAAGEMPAGGKLSHTRKHAPARTQPRITVTYHDADIRDVLAAFSAFAGRTIVVGKGIKGEVSAEVRDQPWDVALRAILQSQGLAAREDESGIIMVDSYANIAAQQALEPLTTEIIPVNYAHAASLAEAVKGLLSKHCGGSPGAEGASVAAGGCIVRGNVAADTATNRLLVTDVPSRLPEIRSYVQDLDVRTPQVAIKSKIIFVNRTNIEDLGISYDLGSQTQFFNRLVQRTDPSTLTPVDSDGDGVPDSFSGTPYPQSTNIIDLGGNALSAIANANQRVIQPALELIFSTAIGKFDLTAFIDALQEVRLADVQAEPSIVTLDNRKAEILVGEETPIRVIDLGAQNQQQAAGGVQLPRATVSFKETGIILSVTPHITNSRQILMTLHSERSQLDPAASDLGYTFRKQRADNQLLVNDGETAVIGGLTVTEVKIAKTGIPILVDLPLIGRLFGRTQTVEDKRDLLILVTPHILDEGEQLGPPPGGDR